MTREQAKDHIKGQLRSYLTEQGIDTGKPFQCLNPEHPDKKPSMSYDPTRQKAHCFSCGADYDTLDVIGIQQGISNPADIFKKAYQIFGITIDGEPSQKQPRSEQNTSTKGKQEDQETYITQAHKKIDQTDYPKLRGLTQATIERFKLGYDPAFKTKASNGEYTTWKALIIPTSPTSYTARNTDPKADKADRIRKQGASPLFNPEAIETDQPVFIVEGELDAMSITEAGGQAIALGSTANYRTLVDYLSTATLKTPVLLALDKDKAGEETTEKLAEELTKQGISFYRVDVSGEYKDPNEALQQDRGAFTQRIKQAEQTQAEELKREKVDYLYKSAAYSINEFIDGIHAKANTPSITTGFTKLDSVLDGGLYEGLYIVGAISSLGKTTLITQIGDQIAQSGQDILLFSLEMAKTEIMAKSISRQTLLNCKKQNIRIHNAKTVRGVTDGKRWKSYSQEETDLLYRSAVDYGGYATRIFIHEGVGSIGATEIRNMVGLHKKITGESPVVIIDYLQILAPYSERATDKQNTDKAVMELKRISRDYKIPVIGISSFNRQSYKDPVTMEAFKESGAIEYSSDVLIGLQLKGVGGSGFNVDEAKGRDPRQIELKILKNRNGRSGDTIAYDYYPAFNYFQEA
ncbi:MAG: toprim domain-containing protein [Bacteroidia bacterium]|nr:toprim domain-containing protein [Bacteroidia bacterium]